MIRVELVLIHSDGEGGKTYEAMFVDDEGNYSPWVEVGPDGTLTLAWPDEHDDDCCCADCLYDDEEDDDHPDFCDCPQCLDAHPFLDADEAASDPEAN